MKIKLINTQKVLSPTNISLADYVINPFRGCEFGCLYCYSQENKNIKRDDFSSCLGVKNNAAQALERELRFKKPKRVLLGSTTECFQYQDLQYNLMEKILYILNHNKIPYTILTKSHLIRNCLPLIAQNKANKIYFTFNSSSNTIIRFLEKKSPLLEERLKTITEIIQKGIDLRIHIGPFIPYISELDKIMKMIPAAVKEIDIELYHHQMGRFDKILEVVEKHMGKDLKEKLKKIYKNKTRYEEFAKNLKQTIKEIQRAHPDKKFFYIVPDFSQYYSSTINYEKAIL
ncbi:MAG: radical SAM protein [Candidatus Omnitrophota bacterium]|nr:MAG: radical SAM protein [Candidatus Omnitrophota bacterium]